MYYFEFICKEYAQRTRTSLPNGQSLQGIDIRIKLIFNFLLTICQEEIFNLKNLKYMHQYNGVQLTIYMYVYIIYIFNMHTCT